MGTNGFFGQISGIFTPADENIFSLIQQQCIEDDNHEPIIDYINKIGINYPIQDYNPNYTGYSGPPPLEQNAVKEIKVILGDGINSSQFTLGKTGMLELEDVIIRYIKFLQTTDNCYIDYQYVPRI